MRTCLITGVDGLIGSHLAKCLLKDNWQIFGIGRRVQPEEPGITYIRADLATNWPTSILPKQIDAVIHLAQSEHYRDFPNSVESLFNVNTLSTLRLLDYARQASTQTFILASSGGIYGYSEKEFNEDMDEPLSPFRENLNFYLGSKLCSEIITENFTVFFNIITLRFFFVYGPYQKNTMLIPRLIHSVANELPITLQGEEGIMINPTYINDAVNAIHAALTLKSSHKINIAGPDVLSLKNIVDIIGHAVGKKPRYQYENTAAKKLIGDIKKMSRILIQPRVGMSEGIQRMLSNGERGLDG